MYVTQGRSIASVSLWDLLSVIVGGSLGYHAHLMFLYSIVPIIILGKRAMLCMVRNIMLKSQCLYSTYIEYYIIYLWGQFLSIQMYRFSHNVQFF